MSTISSVRSRTRDPLVSGFDPIASVFVAQSARPAGVTPLNALELSAVQRALLVIDGTVTKFLEAWAMEPVAVLRFDQRLLRLETPEPGLAMPALAPVIRRRVMLQGERSGAFFAWADSLIVAEGLPAGIADALEADGGGLGRILLDSRVESRRECLWYGRDRPEDVPAAVAALWDGDFLVRAYRVIAGGRPIMLITERFPL